MKRRDLNDKLAQADAAGVWAFTLPSFSALMGGVDPAYLKLMMKRLSDQGVLIRAARGIYVNPHARSRPADVRRGLLRFLRPREINYVSLESKLSEAGVISQIATALTCMTTGSPGRFETPWGRGSGCSGPATQAFLPSNTLVLAPMVRWTTTASWLGALAYSSMGTVLRSVSKPE